MSRPRLLTVWIVATALAAMVGWATLEDYQWTDFEYANQVPFRALVDGDVDSFIQSSSTAGPSMLLRAPFALTSHLWGASDLAIFRLVSVPGLLAAVALSLVLWSLRTRLLPAAQASIVVMLVVVANPLFFRALEIGHPEELLGAALCIGAVLAAVHQRPGLTALLLGLALANKAWAVLAVGPVLLALERRQWSVLLASCGIAALFVAPFLLHSGQSRAAVAAAGGTQAVFQPWQIWWPLGEHGHVVRGVSGAILEGFRTAPGWIGPLTHPLIAFLVVPASLLWRRRHPRRPAGTDVLLLLAGLFLARCVLDPANNGYYHLPFLLSLLAWEALRRERTPVLSVLATAVVWLTTEKLPSTLTPDAQAAIYLLWALPALAALVYAVAGGRAPRRMPAWATARPSRAGSMS